MLVAVVNVRSEPHMAQTMYRRGKGNAWIWMGAWVAVNDAGNDDWSLWHRQITVNSVITQANTVSTVFRMQQLDGLVTFCGMKPMPFDLNTEISGEHVMFGPPNQASVEALIRKERGHKEKLQESDGQLRERLKTIKELLDRYTAREAKILNEIESLREEGRLVWLKAKVVSIVEEQIGNNKNNGRVRL